MRVRGWRHQPPVALTIEVISGNQLNKPGDSKSDAAVNPFVELEVLGEDVDERRVQTPVVPVRTPHSPRCITCTSA
jgi:hypothetical protein